MSESSSNIASRINEASKTAQSPLDFQAKIAIIQLEVLSSLILQMGGSDGYMQDIRAFHEKFKLGYNGSPRELDETTAQFRVKFMQEELDEYKAAFLAGDLHGQFDALIDLVYVALGTAYLQGFPFQEGWRRVQSANMAKVCAQSEKDSKRGFKFDIVKPPGWTAPQLGDLIGNIPPKLKS